MAENAEHGRVVRQNFCDERPDAGSRGDFPEMGQQAAGDAEPVVILFDDEGDLRGGVSGARIGAGCNGNFAAMWKASISRSLSSGRAERMQTSSPLRSVSVTEYVRASIMRFFPDVSMPEGTVYCTYFLLSVLCNIDKCQCRRR
jgi:hypothetical protein